MSSNLLISLDFELHWGVLDHVKLNSSGREYFHRTRSLIPIVLHTFLASGVNATWSTVGLLFARSRKQVEESLPAIYPEYKNSSLNPYSIIGKLGNDEADDPYHYAPSLIEQILATPGQHVGSHTFSHYYCLEPGQTSATFAADLEAAQRLAQQNFGIELTSLVFPRNQYSPDYLDVIAAKGFRSYRTNPNIWFWEAQSGSGTGPLQKAARLADHYLPLDATTAYPAPDKSKQLVDIPASRFFRPYIAKIDAYGGQRLKVLRICNEMTHAAQRGLDYHLWWHPHNMATHPQKNMEALTHILHHFGKLRKQYGMQSLSMEECAEG